MNTTVTQHREIRFPAEWESQASVLMAWPHPNSDWAPILIEAEACFAKIIETITQFQPVHLLCASKDIVDRAKKKLALGKRTTFNNLSFIITDYNDTWTRDYGPITIHTAAPHSNSCLLDFTFNGWGEKYPSLLDNAVNQRLAEMGIWNEILPGSEPIRKESLILEGGSIETDGNGTLMTTAHCLMAPNRNQPLSYQAIIAQVKARLGVNHILTLKTGQLLGDDTDGHIDTLARFCSPDTIVYQGCERKDDEHYEPLKLMEAELNAFRDQSGQPYRCHPLPLPNAKFNDQGERLPATYANFLIINHAVIVPTYNDPHDQEAMAIIANCFPDRKIVGVDCSILIHQGGSLHCSTMQLPEKS